ncbi:malate dehydrogenase, mitochondrial [Megalopta genalis]|uniref:malate dehydrogenase, mitochondrial n=1 Tax=Megalopta genalis TaxID=115081 RepID=UPI003FD46DBF
MIVFLRSIRRGGWRRNISKMPTNDGKGKSSESSKDIKKSIEKTRSNPTDAFNGYDCFLPDQKGDVQVCIIGGGEAPLYTAALLKQSRLIKRLNLVDTTNTMAGAVLDTSHIDTSTRIKHYTKKRIKNALKQANIIALMDESEPKGVDLNPKIQFESAASYVYEMAEQMVTVSSDALVAVFVQPVTATLPMISEIYKLCGWWDPDRIIGSTSFLRMRMEATTASLLDLDPAFLSIPMVAGADPYTIVPLLSRSSPINRFNHVQQEMLLQSLRGADKEIASIDGRGPILSVAAAAAKFILALAGGLSGSPNVYTSGYVRSNVLPICRFFTTELQLGPGGVQTNFGLPKMSPAEVVLVEQAVPIINEFVHTAIKTVFSYSYVKQKST